MPTKWTELTEKEQKEVLAVSGAREVPGCLASMEGLLGAYDLESLVASVSILCELGCRDVTKGVQALMQGRNPNLRLPEDVKIEKTKLEDRGSRYRAARNDLKKAVRRSAGVA